MNTRGEETMRKVVLNMTMTLDGCDGALQSGMEEGVNDSHERLAELLETMSQ